MTSVIDSLKDKLAGTPIPEGQHLAAVLNSAGTPLKFTHRPTQSPGPNELLIEVSSIALNPVDHVQRDLGYMIQQFPTVLGSDIAGTVVSVGSEVSSDLFKPGTRVAAFASAWNAHSAPDYGSFQKRVLVSSSIATPLPHGISFNEAALLPMAVNVAWSGLKHLNIPLDAEYKSAEKQGLLIWGGAANIGGSAIQVAKSLGFTVYTTASEKHHEYLKGLGASRTFDYRSKDVVQSIVEAAKQDDLAFNLGYDAVGSLKECIEILQQLKSTATAKIASAVPLTDKSPTGEGVDAVFNLPPIDETERNAFYTFVWHTWLKQKLETGEFVPSPSIELFPGGLHALNEGLNHLKAGVSGTKIVLEI